MEPTSLLQQQVKLLQEGIPYALATIVKVEGSSPRDTGAKMLIAANGTIFDTIGGGAFEGAVMERAQTLLKTEGGAELFTYTLGPEYGMKCGGRVTVFIEPSSVLEKVLIFGGGHVAKPLAELTHLLGFYTVVVDDRPDFNTPERFPHAQERLTSPLPILLKNLSSTSSTYIIILTRDADLDYEILTHFIPQPSKYLGMIGSQTKLESFKSKLRQSGQDPSVMGRVHSPIGLGIDAETPEEIAVSIAAELVKIRRLAKVPAC